LIAYGFGGLFGSRSAFRGGLQQDLDAADPLRRNRFALFHSGDAQIQLRHASLGARGGLLSRGQLGIDGAQMRL